MKILPSTMRNQFFLYFLTILACVTAPFAAHANGKVDSRQQIAETAEQYVYRQLSRLDSSKIQVSVNPVDARLHIPACAAPFQASASAEALHQSNITVKVTCPVSDWYIYVMARARQMQPVVVLSTMASPGTVLTAQNLQVVEMDKKQLRSSTFADIEDVVGARLKHRTRAGYPVSPSQLCFVCKGDNVVITANAEGLTLKTRGIAEQDGVVGETITVTNRRSQKRVHARVVSANEVSVSI